MTEGEDYVDWDAVARTKPLGLWLLQAYFLTRSGVFAFVAYTFFGHASTLPFGLWLLPAAFAGLYLVGIAAAQGTWRYSRAACIALMLTTLALELISHWVPATATSAAQLKLELTNAGENFGAQLARVFGPALQVMLLIYLFFSRHTREFFKRRYTGGNRCTR